MGVLQAGVHFGHGCQKEKEVIRSQWLARRGKLGEDAQVSSAVAFGHGNAM